jgi:hypothetical protein
VTTKRIAKREALATLAGVLVALTGCGSSEPVWPRGAVKGTVVVDGKPLPKGEVRFVPLGETPGPKTSVPVVDGKFEMDKVNGPVVGHHRIEIESTDDGGVAWDDEEAMRKLAAERKLPAVFRLPPRYNVNSTIEKDISAEGPNEFNFTDLTSR